MTTLFATRLLAIPLVLAMVFILVRLGIFVHLHLTRRQLSILSNTVSDYGTGATRREFTAMGAITVAAYVIVIAIVGIEGLASGWLVAVGALGVLSGAVLLLFPTDLTGERISATGVTHWVFAVVQFAGLFVFMANVPAPTDGPAGLFAILTWAVRISFYTFLVTLAIPKLRRTIFGLTERIFVTVTPLWFATLAAVLLTTPRIH